MYAGAGVAQQPMLAPASYSAQAPVSSEARTIAAHAQYARPATWLGNGVVVALLTAVASFLVMWGVNPPFVRDNKETKRNPKWPAVYSAVLFGAMVAVQFSTGLRRSYGSALINPHTIMAVVVLVVVLGFSFGGIGGNTMGYMFNQDAVRAGVSRAGEFVDAADANPIHFEGMQQAALAEGHLFAFASLYGHDHGKLSQATGVDTKALADRIREVRSSYYA